MDVAYVNPFIISTMETFKTMLHADIKAGMVKLKADNNFQHDISGIIGLSGEAQGSICLSFPKLMALKIVSQLLGSDIKIVGVEVTDGIGEIANIVAGNAKQHLSQYNLSISLPKVVVGKSHYLVTTGSIPTIIVPFVSLLGDFVMEVALKTPDRKK